MTGADVIHYASQPLYGQPSETACGVPLPAGLGGRLDVEWSPYRADVTCSECLDEVQA